MGSKTAERNRFIRAVITALIMPITILAGCAMGYLGCLLIGYLFYNDSEKLLIWTKEGGFIGLFGLLICIGGAIIGAVFPWIILFFFNPESKSSRHHSGNDSTPMIQI